jgi:hypothetical protein
MDEGDGPLLEESQQEGLAVLIPRIGNFAKRPGHLCEDRPIRLSILKFCQQWQNHRRVAVYSLLREQLLDWVFGL